MKAASTPCARTARHIDLIATRILPQLARVAPPGPPAARPARRPRQAARPGSAP
ncbi:MAG: hypothetical protein R3F43_25325 [bacterium]